MQNPLLHLRCYFSAPLGQIKNPHGPDAGFLFAAVSKGEGWEFYEMTCEWQIQSQYFDLQAKEEDRFCFTGTVLISYIATFPLSPRKVSSVQHLTPVSRRSSNDAYTELPAGYTATGSHRNYTD